MLSDPGFVCVLRASTRSPKIGPLLRSFPRLRPEAVWKRGTADAFGRKRKFNGFNLFLAAGTDWKEVGAAMRRRFRALLPLLEKGRDLDIAFVLDVGVTPGERFRYRETRFPADDLARLAAFNVELCVTTHPPAVTAAPALPPAPGPVSGAPRARPVRRRAPGARRQGA